MPEATLYKRLGGYDAIAAAADDLLPRLMNDPQIGVYWKGQSKDTRRKGRQLLVDFLAAAFGGPAVYTGRSMPVSHEGLGISEGDWQVFVKHTLATLDKLGVRGKERDDFLAAAGGLKPDIVGR